MFLIKETTIFLYHRNKRWWVSIYGRGLHMPSRVWRWLSMSRNKEVLYQCLWWRCLCLSRQYNVHV